MEPGALLELAMELADVADSLTMARFRASDLVVDTKPDLTPVSEADRAVEQAIRDLLARRAPDHVVLGEEFGMSIGAEEPRGAGRAASAAPIEGAPLRWVVDPIDGTKSYVRGIPVWATLIGVEQGGEIVAGVASAPALGSRWWAGRGLGAFRDGERIAVSRVHELGDAHLSFAWDTADRFAAERVGERVLGLAHRCWRTRGYGDFWQHVLVADGSIDISIDPVIAYWDIAALLPIVTEAGGRWSSLVGDRDARTTPDLLCTNGVLHDQVVAALAP
jgi:histidinol-phosphatase